jgi:integrase
VLLRLRDYRSTRRSFSVTDFILKIGTWLPGGYSVVCRMGTIWGTEMTEKVVWHAVKQYAGKVGILRLAPHDLRSWARLCHRAGDELEQIQFLLGHVSVQTTENISAANSD